jgi:hypothetical protein
MEFYNANIQIDKKVIDDVFSNFKSNSKMLVFGLGHDSKMWYEGNNKNTYFVENNPIYINMNLNHIPSESIIEYEYNTSVEKSFTLTDKDIHKFEVSKELQNLAPFDIIIIDGPEGYSNEKPGRLIPCYWATLLSAKGTIIYIDDSNRPLENYCINKYFKDNYVQKFVERNECVKIIVK